MFLKNLVWFRVWFRSDFGLILVWFRSDLGLILVWFWSDLELILVSHFVLSWVWFWSSFGPILIWLNFREERWRRVGKKFGQVYSKWGKKSKCYLYWTLDHVCAACLCWIFCHIHFIARFGRWKHSFCGNFARLQIHLAGRKIWWVSPTFPPNDFGEFWLILVSFWSHLGPIWSDFVWCYSVNLENWAPMVICKWQPQFVFCPKTPTLRSSLLPFSFGWPSWQ